MVELRALLSRSDEQLECFESFMFHTVVHQGSQEAAKNVILIL